MDYFKQNEEVLFKEYKKHFKQIEEDGTFFIEEAKNGEPIICINMGNGQVARMSSSYDPTYEASEWAKQYKDDDRGSRLAIYGFGNVYYLRALLKQAWENSCFLVKEPDEKFLSFVMTHFDIRDLLESKQLLISFPDESDEFLRNQIARLVPSFGDDRIEGITMPFYNVNEDFLEMCRRQKLIRDTTLGFNYSLGQRAIFDQYYALWNVHENYSFKTLIEAIPKEVPVIVVAAGPSLLKNGELLKKFKNRALIIACARATPTLHKFGVEAELVSTIDPAQPLKHVERENVGDSYILMDPAGNMDIQKEYKGHVIYANEGMILGTAPGYRGKAFNIGFDGGGSVATWSVGMMKSAGFKTLIVVGQDLAAGKGVTHADGANENDAMDYTEVEGIDGEMVLARADWNRFRFFYEDVICKDESVRFIDATEGGALIHGSEVMTLQEVLDTVCVEEYDLSGIFSNLEKAQTEEEMNESHEFVEKQLDELEDLEKVMSEMEALTGQIRKMMKYKTASVRDLSKKVEKMNPLMDKVAGFSVFNNVARSAIREGDSFPTFGGNFTSDARGEHEFAKLEKFAKDVKENCKVFEEAIREFVDEN